MRNVIFVHKASKSALSILICSGLILGPYFGLAGSSFLQISQASHRISLPVSLQGNVQPSVGVTPKAVDVEVLVSFTNFDFATNCQAPKTQSPTLVQDQGLINLNQSAGCFSLSMGQTAQQAIIKVKPLIRPPVKVAVKNTGVIQKAEIFHGEPISGLATVPQLSLLTVLLFYGLARRIKVRKFPLLRLLRDFRPAFKTLMVFRC